MDHITQSNVIRPLDIAKTIDHQLQAVQKATIVSPMATERY